MIINNWKKSKEIKDKELRGEKEENKKDKM